MDIEKEKTLYKSFSEVESKKLKIENGSEITIVLKMNLARSFKLQYFLNGQEIKPKLFRGKASAYQFWCELVEKLDVNKD